MQVVDQLVSLKEEEWASHEQLNQELDCWVDQTNVGSHKLPSLDVVTVEPFMRRISSIKVLIEGDVVSFILQNAVIVPFPIVRSPLMNRLDRIEPMVFSNVFLVPVGAVDKVPVDELNQEEHIKTMANQVSYIEFESESVPFVIDIVFYNPCSEDVKLIRLTYHLHEGTLLLVDRWQSD